jgi:hypothetical protein
MPVIDRPKLRKQIAENSLPCTVAASLDGQNLRWLHDVRHLAQQDQLEEAMDILFRTLNRWLKQGNFQACDEILEKVSPEWLHLSLSLGILSLTRPASKYLKHRSKFYSRLKGFLIVNRPDHEALLKGLGD